MHLFDSNGPMALFPRRVSIMREPVPSLPKKREQTSDKLAFCICTRDFMPLGSGSNNGWLECISD